MEEGLEELGIYIHIPFCARKCYYCDFISYPDKNNLVEKYIESLEKEMQAWKKSLKKEQYKITTIYIGGGTPSYIEEKHILRILENLKEFINTKVEITIEVNPGTVTKKKLEEYKKA